MPTIKQIADIVGVSRGTVDRVINNRGGVNPATEARIRYALETMNYTPDQAGKTLAAKRKKLKIGMIFRFDNPRYQVTDFVRHKAQDFQAYGIESIILEADANNPSSYLSALDTLFKSEVSGILIMPIDDPSVVSRLSELQECGIPVIEMDIHAEGFVPFATVTSDFERCGTVLGNMLGTITGNAGSTAVVTFPAEWIYAERRLNSLLGVLAENHPDVSVAEIIRIEDDDFTGYARVKRLLEEHTEIESLFINSVSTVGVCRAVEECGRTIKVLSFDSVALPAVKKLVEKGTISVIVSQRSKLQVSISMDLLFDYLVYGTVPKKRHIYTNYEINIGNNLEEE